MRWYHASIQQMEKLLSLVGVPSKVMQLIPSIVDTCRICRTWARNAPDTRIAVRMSTQFNQCVQCDLLFYSDETDRQLQSYIILHMVDECIRWSRAILVDSKEVKDIVAGMTSAWLSLHGPPSQMIWDGECAMNSDEDKQWADRHGIDLILRPRGKKAWIVERHNELLRVQLHKIRSQLQAERIQIPMKSVLD